MGEGRPNVLLVVTDQQRGDALGLDGHAVLETPAMDWIGASGTHFRRGYSEYPSCAPARRVLMSGHAPSANGMVGMTRHPEWDPSATLAGELRDAGYETHLSGKLGLQPTRRRFGFEAMDVANSSRTLDNDYLTWLRGEAPPHRWAMAHGATSNGWIGRPTHLPEEKTQTFWTVSRAIDFLETRDPTAPFFLNVSFMDPHPPFTPPAFFFDRYERMDLPEPVIGDWVPEFPGPRRGMDPELSEDTERWSRRLHLDPAPMHHCRAGYYGLVNHVDMQLNRLFQYMRDKGLLYDTFIMFVSDHGEMLGDHHLFAKTWPYEASVRVPFLARAPRSMGFPSQVEVAAPVGLQDVMPTLLDAAGCEIPESVTGRSLLPWMRGESPAWRDVLHGEHAGQYREADGNHWIVNERHKYIWFSQTGEEHLFDVVEDPNEERDLAAKSVLGDSGVGARKTPHRFPPKTPESASPPGEGEERTDLRGTGVQRDTQGSPDVDLAWWRGRLAEELADRPEGFSRDGGLVVGRPHRMFVPGKGRG
ncbi:MAG: sulfatase-like hydrolase/transferase [Chloroflexota bacterium]|nr:sulfatase-like hydrolase/transferase [Chloroflexota bacterium]